MKMQSMIEIQGSQKISFPLQSVFHCSESDDYIYMSTQGRDLYGLTPCPRPVAGPENIDKLLKG